MLNALEKLREMRLSMASRGAAEVPPLTEAALDTVGVQAERTEGRTYGSQTEGVEQNSALDPVTCAVLNVLVQAGRPVPHPQIVKVLATQGHSKAAAYAAIASCQGQGWIEHNLVSGFVRSEQPYQS